MAEDDVGHGARKCGMFLTRPSMVETVDCLSCRRWGSVGWWRFAERFSPGEFRWAVARQPNRRLVPAPRRLGGMLRYYYRDAA